MRARTWLIISLGLNLLLAGGWVASRRSHHDSAVNLSVANANDANSSFVKTHVVVRRQNFTWEEVESADYVTYIKNLRAIGCPENTIRDIIVADVNQLYAHRRVTEVVSPEQQWWPADPDNDVIKAASA